MKKGIIGILAVTLCFAGMAGLKANAKSVPNALEAVGNYAAGTEKSFTDTELKKLLALKFDDYRHMTISKFQSKVWAMTDNAEYMALLERLSKNETLYQMKDSDQNAAFLFYVLEPLTKEKWQSHTYSGATVSDFSPVDGNARLEYSYTLNILNPDRVMVKDYCDMRMGVTEAMWGILRNRTKEELQNEALMRAEIGNYVDEVIPHLSTEEVGVEIEYAYFPLPKTDEGEQSIKPDNGSEWEPRFYSHGTEEDYNSLLSLKKSGYENMPLADFNSALLDWANEDYERFERIDEDTKWDDFSVDLTEKELSFVKLTVFLSGMENGKAIQSAHAVTELYSPYYGEYLPQKTAGRNRSVWCSLYYQFSYNVSDTEAITVGERDLQIESMINAVQTFWRDTDIEIILKMSEDDIVKELERLAAAYTTDNITITIDKEQIHFECMDERAYAN